MNERADPSARERCRLRRYDAVVVGSGPNGLACAITMLHAGCSVLLVEGQPTAGGGCRSLPLTVAGFRHDVCSAVYPLGMGSPFFRTLPLENYGLKWINPQSAYVHALAAGKAVAIDQNLEATAQNLGASGRSFAKLMASLLPNWDDLCDVLLYPTELMRHPLSLAKFGLKALRSARHIADWHLEGAEARAAFAGVAAHSSLRLDAPGSAAVGLPLAIAAHAVGWPIPEHGAQSLSDSLLGYFEDHGGELLLNCPVRALEDLPPCKFLFFDITPRQFLDIAGEHLSSAYRRVLGHYKYGPSCFKMDWALSEPIPWSSPGFALAPTVHLGGTFEEVAESESTVWRGGVSKHPYVLLAQPTLFDPTRAPEGLHVAWAYCHVPFRSKADYSERIESQIERFAPGFKQTIIAKHASTTETLHIFNENEIGGDINGGTLALGQLLGRPIARPIPYKTPLPNVYLCSASTPPGSGVHGMCGYYAAQTALHLTRSKPDAIEDRFHTSWAA